MPAPAVAKRYSGQRTRSINAKIDVWAASLGHTKGGDCLYDKSKVPVAVGKVCTRKAEERMYEKDVNWTVIALAFYEDGSVEEVEIRLEEKCCYSKIADQLFKNGSLQEFFKQNKESVCYGWIYVPSKVVPEGCVDISIDEYFSEHHVCDKDYVRAQQQAVRLYFHESGDKYVSHDYMRATCQDCGNVQFSKVEHLSDKLSCDDCGTEIVMENCLRL